jgi:hypothetical protein
MIKTIKTNEGWMRKTKAQKQGQCKAKKGSNAMLFDTKV